MRIVDVIAKKRDGHPLSREEIELFVDGVTAGTLPDYQSSALLMAIVIRGMTHEETAWLTDAMVRSGDRVDHEQEAGGREQRAGAGREMRRRSVHEAGPRRTGARRGHGVDWRPRGRSHRGVSHRYGRAAGLDHR